MVNYIREFEISAGVPRDHVYDVTMYVLAGMLVAGFVCNYLIKPLADKWYMKPEEVAALRAEQGAGKGAASGSFGIGRGGLDAKAAMFWAIVGIPLAWGVWKTLVSAISFLIAPFALRRRSSHRLNQRVVALGWPVHAAGTLAPGRPTAAFACAAPGLS